MYSPDDLASFEEKEISVDFIKKQLSILQKGVSVIDIQRIATLDDGISVLEEKEEESYVSLWNSFLEKGKQVVHFIPASGTASRLFRSLYNFWDADYSEPQTNCEKNFFKHLSSFAFYGELNLICVEKEKKDIQDLIEEKQYKLILEYMLTDKGANYSSLPNALFKFHTDKSKKFAAIRKYLPKKLARYYNSFENTRTPIQENLVESAMVSGLKKGAVNVHFTVNQEHKEIIEDYIREFKEPIEKKLGVDFEVILSNQKTSTDTVMLTENNELYRDENGKVVFRTAGHGALIDNLNGIQADIVFIKNIDNVVPDAMKKMTSHYKKMLGGILIDTQKKITKYIKLIDKGDLASDKLIEIVNFVENDLNVKHPNILKLEREEQLVYLKQKLNRPLRVCGMVKKEEEHGGEPFWVKNEDGTVSLQIVEFYQVNNSSENLALFDKATHFNPVDIVCSLVDYKGKKFDLTKYVDKKACMLSKKIMNGVEVRRLDFPGLWNGGMANWNTIFIEVPVKTFNPVKTINDLLRYEHQNQ